jgi:Mg2+ and Co2+ transporter CorA
MPWLKEDNGFWLALGVMGLVALCLVLIFTTKQYLSSRTD